MDVTTLPPLTEGYALQVIQAIVDNKTDTPWIKPATKLILPWPDKRLSPNARIHWASRAKAVKSARQISFHLARQAG